MSKRPKDMSDDDLSALPIEPDEWPSGMYTLGGIQGDDSLVWVDPQGDAWTFKNLNGQWYRTPW